MSMSSVVHCHRCLHLPIFVVALPQDIDTACRRISHRLRPCNPANDTAFGGLHFVATGDFAQHDPVKAKVLYHGAADDSYIPILNPTMQQASPSATAKHTGKTARAMCPSHVTSREVYGRQLWTQFDQCIVLKEQHRFDLSNPAGKKLYDIVQQLTTGKDLHGNLLTEAQVANIADVINACAVPPEDMPRFLQLKPKALVLRHVHRPLLTRTLVSHHASVNKTRAVVWRAQDCIVAGGSKTGKELSPALLSMLESSAVHPDKLPAIMYFYPSIPYRFVSNEFPLLGWVNNAECVGHSIILHENEPDDPLTGDFRVLHYPPKAIMVSIVGRNVADLFDDPVPANCIPVFPKHSTTFLVDWSKTSLPIKLYKDVKDLTTANKFSVRRTSFPLEPALTFTDFFAQGQSFKGDPHLLHLNIGKTEGYKKANILVPVSRPANLDDLKLANPLWPAGDRKERARVIKKIANALKPDRHYEAEMARLQDLHNRTWAAFHTTLQPPTPPQHTPATPTLRATPTPLPVSPPPRPAKRQRPTPEQSQPLPQQQNLVAVAAIDPSADPDCIITQEIKRRNALDPSSILQQRLAIIGRAQCGFSDTEALGDCGPLAILQSMLLQTQPLLHSNRPLQATVRVSQVQADRQCAELRSAISAAIHQHQDLQHIASVLFRNPNQTWERLAAELGTCVAEHRRRQHGQTGSGTWLNSLGLRACARHLQRDIIALGGPTGHITLYLHTPGPHFDDLGNVYNTHNDTCIDCTLQGFIPACAFEASTIVIRNDSNHFWCTRPLVPHNEDLQSALQLRHAQALDAGHDVRALHSQVEQ